jgi:hypothetical protein
VSSGQAGAIGMALLKKYPVLSRTCIFRQALSSTLAVQAALGAG